MKIWKGLLAGVILSTMSCSTESSIVTDNSIEISRGVTNSISPEKIVYASTISNLISTFPKFKNDALNSEVKLLKKNLTDYLTAMQTYSVKEKKEAIKQFEDSYKKIQKLRKFINLDDDQILNRYLVKIKTNISLLEAIDHKESHEIISSN